MNSMARRLALCALLLTTMPAQQSVAEAPTVLPLSQAIDRNLERVRIALEDDSVSAAVRKANSAHANMTPKEIEALDARWAAAKGVDDFVRPYVTGPCARLLREIQEENAGIAEAFITDKVGLNVCQTNKTSDLYQADEDWWKRAWNGGKGERYHGGVEHDDSAGVDAVSAYDVLKDPTTGEAIGVIKVVIDVTNLKQDL